MTILRLMEDLELVERSNMIGEIESWRMEKDHKISEHKRRKIDRRLVKEEERERKLKLERYTIVSTRASVLSVTGKGLGFLR